MATTPSESQDQIPLRKRNPLFQRPSLLGSGHRHSSSLPSNSDPSPRLQGLRRKDRSSSWLSHWSSKSSDIDGDDTAWPRDSSPHATSPADSRSSLERATSFKLTSPQLNIDTKIASEESLQDLALNQGSIILHGEVRSSNAKWRKHREYLVLTDNHLIRFKSQTDALYAFSESARESQSAHTHSPTLASPVERPYPSIIVDAAPGFKADRSTRLPLSYVIAIARVQDVDAPASLIIHSLADDVQHSSSWTIHFFSLTERDEWEEKIGMHARLALGRDTHLHGDGFPSTDGTVTYTAGSHMFRVIRILEEHVSTRSPSTIRKVSPAFTRLSVDAECIVLHSSIGLDSAVISLITVSSVELSPTGTRVVLQTSVPFRRCQTFEFASIQAPEIVMLIDQRLQVLRPHWSTQPYIIKGQNTLVHVATTTSDKTESAFNFGRMLRLYAMGYSQDVDNINYSLTGTIDCLHFQLLPSPRGLYNSYELLAVLRSLYFANGLQTLSFSDISFTQMGALYDYDNLEHFKTASAPLQDGQTGTADISNSGLFLREIFAIIATNPTLYQLDVSQTSKSARGPTGLDCGIPQVLYTLLVSGVTTIRWLLMNGVALSKDDLQFLYLIADQPSACLQGLDVSDTGLNQHDATQLLRSLQTQAETLEYLNLANNVACLNQCSFDGYMTRFHRLTSLDLSNLQLSKAIRDPLLSASTLSNWQLRELKLSNTFVGEATVQAICSYLYQEQSSSLATLHLEGCEITGYSMALLLQAASHGHYNGRPLALFLGRNNATVGHQAILNALESNDCTDMLSLDNTEYHEQRDLEALCDALRVNTSLQSLSLSRIRLLTSPYLNDSTLTAIERCFAENNGIRNVDLSSSSSDSNADQVQGAPGIARALKGLRRRKALLTLNLDHQKLGNEGAHVLADILQFNPHLTEIYCEQSAIPLLGLEAIIDVLKTHYSLTYISDMEDSKLADLEELGSVTRRTTKLESPPSRAMQVLNGFEGKITTKRLHRRRRPTFPPVPLNRSTSDDDLARRWEEKQTLLFEFLERNRRIAAGEIDAAAFADLGIN